MSVAIRAATPADTANILGFVRELAAFEREPDTVAATGAMLAEALFAERPAAECVIAERDAEAVGFALWFMSFSTWTGRRGLYLEDLYVAPAARRRGAGRALLRHLAGIALDRGCARFEWAVLDWNADAVGFYRALGAVGLDEWTVQRVSGEALARLAGR